MDVPLSWLCSFPPEISVLRNCASTELLSSRGGVRASSGDRKGRVRFGSSLGQLGAVRTLTHLTQTRPNEILTCSLWLIEAGLAIIFLCIYPRMTLISCVTAPFLFARTLGSIYATVA
jgi:hypothetical protein